MRMVTPHPEPKPQNFEKKKSQEKIIVKEFDKEDKKELYTLLDRFEKLKSNYNENLVISQKSREIIQDDVDKLFKKFYKIDEKIEKIDENQQKQQLENSKQQLQQQKDKEAVKEQEQSIAKIDSINDKEVKKINKIDTFEIEEKLDEFIQFQKRVNTKTSDRFEEVNNELYSRIQTVISGSIAKSKPVRELFDQTSTNSEYISKFKERLLKTNMKLEKLEDKLKEQKDLNPDSLKPGNTHLDDAQLVIIKNDIFSLKIAKEDASKNVQELDLRLRELRSDFNNYKLDNKTNDDTNDQDKRIKNQSSNHFLNTKEIEKFEKNSEEKIQRVKYELDERIKVLEKNYKQYRVEQQMNKGGGTSLPSNIKELIHLETDHIYDFMQEFVNEMASNCIYSIKNPNKLATEKMDCIDFMVRNIEFVSAKLFDLFEETCFDLFKIKNSPVSNFYHSVHKSNINDTLVRIFESIGNSNMDGAAKKWMPRYLEVSEIVLLSKFNQNALFEMNFHKILINLVLANEGQKTRDLSITCISHFIQHPKAREFYLNDNHLARIMSKIFRKNINSDFARLGYFKLLSGFMIAEDTATQLLEYNSQFMIDIIDQLEKSSEFGDDALVHNLAAIYSYSQHKKLVNEYFQPKAKVRDLINLLGNHKAK